jgi:hypothetical protein
MKRAAAPLHRKSEGIVPMTRKTALALIAIFALSFGAFAQGQKKKNRDDSNTRIVQGIVTDPADAPVPGAVVQLKDTKTLQVRSFYTQPDGTYHFAGLSTNVDYELKAEKSGSSSGTKTLTVFDSRKTAIINLKLNK